MTRLLFKANCLFNFPTVLWTSAVRRGRENLGFPEDPILDKWLDCDVKASFPGEESVRMPAIKNSEIPKLDDYVSDPDEKFWEYFPRKELPVIAETMIDIDALERRIGEAGC